MIAPSAGTVNLLLDDRLGTPQMAASPTQAIVWRAAYTPFGYTYALSGSLQQNLRMAGQTADSNAGWYHNGWRDYMPTWGRYLQTDPIGLAAGMNTYGYVGQNPLRFVDPWGLDDQSVGDPGAVTPICVECLVATIVPLPRVVGWIYDAYQLSNLASSSGCSDGTTPVQQNPLPKNFVPPTNEPQNPQIPTGWISRPGSNGQTIWQPPDLDPNSSGPTIRIDPNPRPGYPNGKWTQTNPSGQPIIPGTNNTGRPEQTHIPLPPAN
jgi:RHS repeat-associated protein